MQPISGWQLAPHTNQRTEILLPACCSIHKRRFVASEMDYTCVFRLTVNLRNLQSHVTHSVTPLSYWLRSLRIYTEHSSDEVAYLAMSGVPENQDDAAFKSLGRNPIVITHKCFAIALPFVSSEALDKVKLNCIVGGAGAGGRAGEFGD